MASSPHLNSILINQSSIRNLLLVHVSSRHWLGGGVGLTMIGVSSLVLTSVLTVGVAHISSSRLLVNISSCRLLIYVGCCRLLVNVGCCVLCCLHINISISTLLNLLVLIEIILRTMGNGCVVVSVDYLIFLEVSSGSIWIYDISTDCGWVGIGQMSVGRDWARVDVGGERLGVSVGMRGGIGVGGGWLLVTLLVLLHVGVGGRLWLLISVAMSWGVIHKCIRWSALHIRCCMRLIVRLILHVSCSWLRVYVIGGWRVHVCVTLCIVILHHVRIAIISVHNMSVGGLWSTLYIVTLGLEGWG